MPDQSNNAEIQEHERAAFNEARIGIELEAFASTPVGKFLIDKADREYSAASKDLITIPAHDHERIAEAQLKARVVVFFKAWMAEGINAGRVAEAQLKENDGY